MSSILTEPQGLSSVLPHVAHLRDVEWRTSGNGKDFTFKGTAVMFDEWSELLWTPRGDFRERIRPGAFPPSLLQRADVRLLHDHKGLVLARTKSGTMELKSDSVGLHVWARVAPTQTAMDLKMAMERGDIDQMSFLFEMEPDDGAEERWWHDERTGELRRDVVRVSNILDVTIATFPAYEQTVAEMRGRAIPRSLAHEPADVTRLGSHDRQYVPGLGTPEERTRRRYSRTLQVFTETTWAMHPPMIKKIADILQERSEGVRHTVEEIRERIGEKRDAESEVVGGSVAVIPVVGPIVPRADMFSEVSGMTSHQAFLKDFRAAVADPSISSIVLDIDSPGGQHTLTPETAAEIFAARSQKQIVGVANGMAASAAYWMLCACDEAVVTPSGDVGSIGVYAMHVDASEEMAMKGQDVTFISAGKYKVEGNPFEPLSAEAKDAMQHDVDAAYKDFIAAVAKYRGVPVDTVRQDYGQGRVLNARDAKAVGMVDRIDTLDNVVATLSKRGSAAGGSRSRLFVSAIAPHSTTVVDEPWDGPGEEAKLPNPVGQAKARAMYAWKDDQGDPDQKSSYKFPHHMVNDGSPGPANINGVNNAMSRLSQANIPAADRAGVERHLKRHQDDFHKGDSAEQDMLVLIPDSAFESRTLLVEALTTPDVAADPGDGETEGAPEEVADQEETLAARKADIRQQAVQERLEYVRLLGRIGK